MRSATTMIRTATAGANVSRRVILSAGAALAAVPAFADECRIGPAPHTEGPHVWMDMDQAELDAAYNQSAYAPLGSQILKRFTTNSDEVRQRLGEPQREAYGPSDVEKLDIYRTRQPNAPI